ncbi:unannotated protein [freshwater metagenome]|uniref:Unannotated protein n=1 Tax=freshwater metagenome TaxID=449393 RepID=A0A6J6CTS6_9ZZZZ|nr:DUF305 domain-containing protein [Actinomycetota bacterium]
MSRYVAAVASISLMSALVLSGCSAPGAGDHDYDHESMGTSSEMPVTMSDGDIMFAQMMIPHHEQAIEMSTLAETRTENADVLALAQQIKSAQMPEISQMTTWLADAGAPLSMGHDMGDDGMLSADEMTTLTNATGIEFDRLFLAGMIAHHQGALEMAKTVQNSKNAEVKVLSDNISSSQTAEIEEMKKLLANL